MGVPAVDLTDAAHHLSDLVDEASRTGEVVLTRAGEAVAKIIPLHRPRVPRRRAAPRGCSKWPTTSTTPPKNSSTTSDREPAARYAHVPVVRRK
jgi:prevent-host-death family protein